MTSIEDKADWESYQEVFGDLWESATIRLSLIESEEHKIPNGEIIFHRESRTEETNTLYSINGFEIYEETVSNPFEVVQGLFNNDLQVDGSQLSLEFQHLDGNTTGFFQTGISESRVFDDRPRAELNSVFKPDLSDDIESAHQDAVNKIDQRIKTADEPFFDIAKSEYYYFDHHFKGKSSADPMVLIFADPSIRFEVDDENGFTLHFPIELAEKTTIVAYPIQPYGEHSGWKIEMSEQDLEVDSDGLVTYTESLDLDEIQQLYLSVYVGDKMMGYERHYNQNVPVGNDRFRLFQEYDQRGVLLDYLTGENPNQFETAVLNLLGIAGYIVQWFGETNFNIPNPPKDVPALEEDEVDIIAHSPDSSHIAFVECTNQRISEKRDIVDRMESVTSGIIGEERIELGPEPQWATRTIPCIATSQSPDDINDQVVEDLEGLGIVVLDSEDLISIYRASAEQDDLVRVGGDPGFWLRQRK
jgi:hypothetical protein